MSGDREQTRLDADAVRRVYLGDEVERLASAAVALLAELEQAERERDELHSWWTQAAGNSADAQARLAKVPALVEAVTKAMPHFRREDRFQEADYAALRDALAAYEQEQP